MKKVLMIVFLVLLILRLSGAIAISWWWVMLPLALASVPFLLRLAVVILMIFGRRD